MCFGFARPNRACVKLMVGALLEWSAQVFAADAAPTESAGSPPHGALEQPAGHRFAQPAGELTLARAIEAALARNPELSASAYELQAADARIEQARLRPNPELSVELENFAGTGVTRGVDALESTLSLSQVIELGSQRSLRTDVALGGRDIAEIEGQARQLDVLAEVARRFIDVIAAQERVELAASTRDVARQTLDAITVRVNAARSAQAEHSRARIALTRARIEEEQAQSELRSARVALVALWGSTDPAFSRASADLFVSMPLKPFEPLVQRLERNPDFLRFASEARLRQAELRLARAQVRPNLTFGAGVRQLSESNDRAFVASFSLPLPLHDRNPGAIREAEARLAQSSASREAAFLRARTTVYALYEQLVAARARLEALRTAAIPEAEQALEQTKAGYERGRFSYLELATAQQDVLELRAAMIDAAADFHRVLAEIERLTGEPLAPKALEKGMGPP